MICMDGFSYNGKHSGDFGVWYVPDPAVLWTPSPDFEVFDSEDGTRDGGSYYKNRVKKRVFTLACYYEDITIETREKIRAWLNRNTAGMLIFDERPFEYYIVHPTKIVPGKQYTQAGPWLQDTISGTMTITFTAYWPFGYMKYKSYNGTDLDNASAYCGILPDSKMPAAPTTSSRDFLVYNCGTEVCDTEIT